MPDKLRSWLGGADRALFGILSYRLFTFEENLTTSWLAGCPPRLRVRIGLVASQMTWPRLYYFG